MAATGVFEPPLDDEEPGAPLPPAAAVAEGVLGVESGVPGHGTRLRI